MKTVLIAAVTADGFIGRDANHFADWTGAADKKLFVEVTKSLGTVVMGSRTFETIGRALPGRRTIVYSWQPADITAPNVEGTNEPPEKLVARLAAEGANGLAVCGGASIYSLFMNAGLVDELYLTVVNKLFGSGVPLLGKPLECNLELIETKQLDANAVMLHYRVIR